MSNMVAVLLEEGYAYPSRAPFGGVRAALIFSFLFCVFIVFVMCPVC